MSPAIPSQRSDLERITALFAKAFGPSPLNPELQRSLLLWKYFERGPNWAGTRSYLLADGRELAAHAAFTPTALELPGGDTVRTNVFSDWAANPAVRGAGTEIMRQLMKLADASILPAGSAGAKAVAAKLGCVNMGQITLYARVLRPWAQFRRQPPERRWKAVARLARNTAWSLRPLGGISPEWAATPASSFEPLAHPGLAASIPARTPLLHKYWLECPVARVSGYSILHRSVPRGHLILATVGPQARLGDLRIDSVDPWEWTTAYRLAVRAAREDPNVCEIVAAALHPLQREILQKMGFVPRSSGPLNIYDPQGKLAGAPPVLWNMFDDDAAYLLDPARPFAT